MDSWKQKANDIIGSMCFEAWKKANTTTSGKAIKKHVPYSVPADAEMLVECLRNNNEERAKAYFMKRAMFGDDFREV